MSEIDIQFLFSSDKACLVSFFLKSLQRYGKMNYLKKSKAIRLCFTMKFFETAFIFG